MGYSDVDDEDDVDGRRLDEPRNLDIKDLTSSVTCQTTPNALLKMTYKVPKLSNSADILLQAIAEDDMEKSEKVLDLFDACEEDAGKHALFPAIEHDRPEMVDVLIRRYGVGIESESDNEDDWHEAEASKGRKPYLGLTIHGRKRKDLAKKVEGNPNEDAPNHHTMLWMAAKGSSPRTIEYLAGDEVLSSYQAYLASCKPSNKANQLRKACESIETLQPYLGWTMHKGNETPMTAALCGEGGDKTVTALKVLFRVMLEFMKATVNKP